MIEKEFKKMKVAELRSLAESRDIHTSGKVRKEIEKDLVVKELLRRMENDGKNEEDSAEEHI